MFFKDGFYSREAERSAIGSFLIDQRALKHVPSLSAEDFVEVATKTAFRAVTALCARRERVDLVTVSDELTRMNQTEHLPILVDCTQYVPSAANAGQYVKIVRDMSARRRLRDIAQATVDAISDPTSDTSSVIDRARQELRGMTGTTHKWVEMPELLLNTYAHLERLSKGEIQPIRAGIPTLDKLIGGFFPGEFTVIGARPGVGKSALAMNIGLSAGKTNKHVGIVSLEMYDQQFGQRILSEGSGVNGMKLRTGNIDADAWMALSETMAEYSDLPISFIFTSNTLEDIAASAQRRADEGRLDMLIIDYLQLMRTRQRFEAERLRVGHISNELKRLSKDLNIPVIALAQLRRLEAGKNHVPRMSDLRESGNIEQDADGIILLHRAESANDPGTDKRDRESFDNMTRDGKHYILFNVAKQRQGEIGAFATIFDPAAMKYRMIDRIAR